MSRPSDRRPTSGEGWALVGSCPTCGRDEGSCRCRAPRPPPGGPILRLHLEKRRGKPITVVRATGVEAGTLPALLKEVKVLCGAGGTSTEGEMEVQGDHRQRLRPILAERGYTVKG